MTLRQASPWFLLLAALGCTPPNEYVPPPPPQVTVAQPVEREVAEYLEFTGTTRAVDVIEVRARVNGYLHEIKFTDGQDVTKGDPLFVIDQRPFEVALASAEASLKKADARRELAEADLKRTEPLVQRGALPQQELDVKRADLATARADVAAAMAAIDQAELNLTYTTVRAAISGRISQHMVDRGNLVQAETTVMARIESYKPIHAYFSVSERDMLRLPRGNEPMPTEVSTEADDSGRVLMGLGDSNDYPFVGTLDYADLGVDAATGTQLRRAVFPNAEHKLVPGLFVRVRVPVTEPKPQLMIDERAIASDQQGSYLLVVNDENVVEYRPVQLGIRNEGMRVIASGVKEGEWVVVNGVQRARPGAPVTPQKEEAAAENTAARVPAEHMTSAGE